MPKIKLSPYQIHKQTWSNCTACSLCQTRQHVVLCRGTVPTDVLLIGEAPGMSEDSLGKPFAGPAGYLLDQIINEAWNGRKETYAMTNLISCIPVGVDGVKIAEPSQESIEACAPRLKEFVKISNPKLIICVGQLAAKWTPKIINLNKPYREVTEIIHPAAILRANIAQQSLMVKRCVVAISNALEKL